MHIGLILDGNRRFAKKLALQPWKGHEFGAETVEKLLDWCKELDIHELTLYALSIENLKRDKTEVNFLLGLMEKMFVKFRNDERIKKNKVRIRFIGKLELLPESLQKLCLELEEDTKNYDKYKLNLCVAYGGRQELVHAMKKLKESNEEINEENIKKNLWLESEPDLIIRTGGQMRTSNFLPWQSIYSEWFFLDKLWPEFSKEDLVQVIEQFNQRQRNFGK